MAPPPWQYDIKEEWVHGENKRAGNSVPPSSMQKMKYKWKSVKGDDQVIEKGKRFKPGKIDKSVSKRTFIDQIIVQNSKKSYPMPGPGAHFNDKKAAQLFDEDEVRSLVVMPAVTSPTKKFNSSQAKRTMTFVDEKVQKAIPGPGQYFKDQKTEIKEVGKNFKSYQKAEQERKEHEREKVAAEKNRVTEVKDKIKGDIPKFPQVMPADYMNFDRYQQKYGTDKDRRKAKARKEKGRLILYSGKGFGSQERFELSDLTKWKKEVENFNAVSPAGKTLDPKKDKMPGPAQYSLINGWEGKKTKNKKLNEGQFPSIFKRISKGPEVNIYYQHN